MSGVITPAVEAIISDPLRTRDDMITLLHSLITPVHAAMSPQKARVILGHSGAVFDVGSAHFEGYARSLWGLTPLWSSTPDEPRFREFQKDWIAGLIAGVDPTGEEYWGDYGDRDQKFVEMAAMGFSLCIAPQVFWEPLSEKTKGELNKWLLGANDYDFPPQNWRFFRIFLNLGLKKVGAEYSQEAIDRELNFVDSFYGEHGMPADGEQSWSKSYDYYATSFAIPFYGLIYARLCGHEDPIRAQRFRERAKQNMPEAIHLFAPDGAAIPFGRSMAYRFACSCFWAAVAFDELELPEPFTWGVIKGLLLRNIRYFTQNPEIFNRDGSLTIGWSYPTLFMSEDYNSPQSPYWALKSFLVLSLPATHPFWKAEEEPYPTQFLKEPSHTVKPWMQTFSHARNHTFLLSSGQEIGFPMRGAIHKYGKFAYSAHFGFSVPTGVLGQIQLGGDSMLAITDDPDELAWEVRHRSYDVEVGDNGIIKSTWEPYAGTEITTWLIPPPTTTSPYHTRIHRIRNTDTTSNDGHENLKAVEGGFANYGQSGKSTLLERKLQIRKLLEHESGIESHGKYYYPHASLTVSKFGVSGVVDLLGKGKGKVQDQDGSSNLVFSRSVLPSVEFNLAGGGEGIDGNETWLANRIFAIPFIDQKETEWIEDWRKVQGTKYGDVKDLLKELGIEP